MCGGDFGCFHYSGSTVHYSSIVPLVLGPGLCKCIKKTALVSMCAFCLLLTVAVGSSSSSHLSFHDDRLYSETVG